MAPWELAGRADRLVWQRWALTGEGAEAEARELAVQRQSAKRTPGKR